MHNIAQSLWSNKHTSGSAVVFFACELVNGISRIWCPELTPKVQETTKLIQHLAIGYGLIMAGDAKPDKPSTENKPDEKIIPSPAP